MQKSDFLSMLSSQKPVGFGWDTEIEEDMDDSITKGNVLMLIEHPIKYLTISILVICMFYINVIIARVLILPIYTPGLIKII